MNIFLTTLISFLTIIGTVFIGYNYVPIQFIEGLQIDKPLTLGTSVTTIQGTDRLSDSRTTINNNFTALNSGKIENSTTTLEALTSAANLVTIGTITSGTWNGSLLTVAYGGTASTSLASNQVIIGNGTSGFKTVVGFGASGQFLASNGNATAPSWQSGSFDTTLNYDLTGIWQHHASTTFWNGLSIQATTSPLCFSGSCLFFSANQTIASGTVMRLDGNNNAKFQFPEGRLLTSMTLQANQPFATTSTFSAVDHLRVLIDSRGLSGATSFRMYFNSDAALANYGGVTYENYANPVINTDAGVQIVLNGLGTTSASWYDISINNQAGFRKIVNFIGSANSSGAATPKVQSGTGVWNNTAAQITSLVIGPGNVSNNLNSGTKIYVFED